jgi:hypothetical protein
MAFFSSLAVGIGKYQFPYDQPSWQLLVFALSTQGAQGPKQAWLATRQDNNGNWQAGMLLPGQGPGSDILQLVTGNGNGGNLQVIGLNFDATPVLVAWQNSSDGSWHGVGSLRLSLGNIRYSQLITGNSVDGNLQLIGLGAKDNLPYLAAYQDGNGNWHATDKKLSARRYAQLAIGYGTDSRPYGSLKVIGLGLNGVPYVAAELDREGLWFDVEFDLPGIYPTLSKIVIMQGADNLGDHAFDVIGLTQQEGRPYVAGWLDMNGSWQPGQGLSGGRRYSQLAASGPYFPPPGNLFADFAFVSQQLMGLGAEDGFAYSAASWSYSPFTFERVWHPGIRLNDRARLSQLVVGPSTSPNSRSVLEVIGLDEFLGLEVLQLCRYSVIGWPDAPPNLFGLRTIQVAPI